MLNLLNAPNYAGVQRDSEREFSPLIPAKDAVYIDSSDMSIDQVVEEMLSLVQ